MDSTSALDNGIERPARWSLRLFGGFELNAIPSGERVALPGKRERVLLAYLALSPNCRQPRRKLAALLWGDAADETLLDNLRNCLWGLRKALGDTEHRTIASEGEDILLDTAAFDVDALALRLLAAQAGRSELEAAAKLYSGEFLDGLDIDSEEFESWRRAEGARCRDQAVDVLSRLMTQLGECGETERAVETGLRILRLEPLHEAAVRRLMRLYGASGRRGAAVQLYRALADALKTELGAQPEAETRAVFAELARGGEDLTSDAPDEPSSAAALPARSTVTARPSDAPAEPPPPPTQQHAPAIGAPWQAKRSKLGWILTSGLAAVVATFLVYQFVPRAGTTTAQQQTSPAGTITIAVLPFTNLSSDVEQEFFSDGITEEITSALAKVPGLIVIGRTSAFEFKGQNKDLRRIGQALGTTHLIEGSVRKAGTRVRITAQLIVADSGAHLWTENYDRELTDVFAIQEDIATAIATSLRVPLGLQQGDTLVRNRTNNPESYDQYLRARALYRARSPGAIEGATKILEQVVARDPGYAPAWALLARVYRDGSKKEKAAREAIRLDSRNAMGYLMLAGIQTRLGNDAAAEDLEKQALALDPDDTDVLDAVSNGLAIHGRVKEAMRMREKLRTLEPFVPVYNYITASIMLNNGQSQAAISILKELPAGPAGGGEGARGVTLARAYAAEGRYGEAADTLLAIPPQQSQQNRGSIEEAARLLRNAPTKVSMPDALPAWDGELSFVYVYVGAPDRVLDMFERLAAVRGLDPPAARYLWSSELAPVRKTKRFKAFVRAAGHVDYWRARGWSELCRPVGADDFTCE
jgi:TolB-like protein/DNA-binding SARP family transcriptional activator